jgi:uncharacterized coiled-coil DUF342 family protein
MKESEVLLMKSLAMSMAGASGRNTVCMTGRAAGELSKLIFEALDELACEVASVKAYRVSCASLEKERDSLKAKLDEQGKSCSVLLGQREEYRRERDALRRELERLDNDAGSSDREILRLTQERDSLREKYEKALTLRDRVIEEIQEVKKERDFLKGKVESFAPVVVEFASQLRDQCQGLIDKSERVSAQGVS